MKQMDHIFYELGIDVLLTPAVPIKVPYLTEAVLQSQSGESDVVKTDALMRYMSLSNFAGLPSLVLPVNYTQDDYNDDSLPVGIQIYGYYWNEHILFRVASAIEQEFYKGTKKFPAHRVVYKGL
ncbi:amidase family protein [Reticulomyxa filosa]|uniref:Amidase family protein n=1 Tax=Reticulomyxa filosa TaxID=46433 RepID=X6NXS3_RETFI|nr:amidase family protein [Reticulomyxa filosa]|eukprot:ETO31110.1 amidase family protein [Reticulomyxa filosa]